MANLITLMRGYCDSFGDTCDGCIFYNINGSYECKFINSKVTDKEKEALELKAKKLNFRNLSEYLSFIGLNAEITVQASKVVNRVKTKIKFTKEQERRFNENKIRNNKENNEF